MARIVDECLRVLRLIPKTLGLVWDASKSWTIAWLAVLILKALVPVVTVLLIRRVVDDLMATVGEPESSRDLSALVLSGGALCVVFLFDEILKVIQEYALTGQAERIQDRVTGLIHRKSTEVDFAFFESPAWFDRLSQATSQGSARSLGLIESCGSIIQGAITLFSLTILLFTYSLYLPLAIIAGAVPSLYVLLVHNRRHHKWWDKSTALRRKGEYIDFVLTKPNYAAELRLFELENEFLDTHTKIRKQLREENLALVKARSIAQIQTNSISVLVMVSCLGWMGLRVLSGLSTFGDVALFHQTLVRGQTQLGTFFKSLGKLYENGLFLEKMFEFLAIQPTMVAPAKPSAGNDTPRRDIVFKNVEFNYPGTDRKVFKGLNLEIEAGSLVAIVGRNGAGKTTLVKLLSRLYDPSSGQIEFDGKDIKELTFSDLRRAITVLHQLPMVYVATARENIAYGDVTKNFSDKEMVAAAETAGAWEFLKELPDGLDSLLGKGFAGGHELSTGQWQRVALARSCIRDSKIVVLDEPTSFMDPWAEVKWIAGIKAMLRGRTAIMITHRFSSARLADKIHVMDGGHIAESGSHDELMAINGLYAASWREQEENKLRE